jgi:hypothetical protein
VSSRLGRAAPRLLVAVIAFALIGGRLLAAQAAPPLDLRYGFYWGGFQIAELTLRHRVERDSYRSDLIIETVGLLETLVRYRADVHAVGERRGAESLAPMTYLSEYQTRRNSRRTMVTFNPETGDVVDLEMTKRGRPDQSKVPAALRRDVIDPLSAFFQIRAHAASARPGQELALAVFDGRRRYDVVARAMGQGRAWVAGRDRGVVRLNLTLTQLAGSDMDGLDPSGSTDQRIEFELLLSDDQRLLPLRMRTLDRMITARVELLEDCSGEAGCQLAAAP